MQFIRGTVTVTQCRKSIATSNLPISIFCPKYSNHALRRQHDFQPRFVQTTGHFTSYSTKSGGSTATGSSLDSGELHQSLSSAQEMLEKIAKRLQIDVLQKELQEIQEAINSEGFWETKQAQATVKRQSMIQNQIEFVSKIRTDINNNRELLEMIQEEQDSLDSKDSEDMVNDMRSKMERVLRSLRDKDLDTLFTEKEDKLNCYLEIHAGAGGTESMDWASMLMNMYIGWGKNNGLNIYVQEVQDGKIAGIKHASLFVTGTNAYGWLKNEHGVHRLVRCSPFDANNKRHTSFASVSVFPEADDSIDIVINPKDLKIETMRASGAGGQHVNKTDSAVRITHEPTGIVVSCQDQRDQQHNKKKAMRVLHSKLYALELAKKAQHKHEQFESLDDVNFGSQIRSYVLHPYKLVKDLRTNSECTDPDTFLSGEGEYMKEFMKEMLEAKFKENEATPDTPADSSTKQNNKK